MSERSQAILHEIRHQKEEMSSIEEELARSFVSFRVGNGWYGIDVEHVEGVIRVRDLRITDIPSVPSYIMGITHVRGEILSVVNLRSLLELPEEEWDPLDPCLLMVSHQGVMTALYVDDLDDLIDLRPSVLLSSRSRPDRPDFIKGEAQVEGKVVTLIDAARLLTSEKMCVGGG